MGNPRASYMEQIAAFNASCETAGIETNDGILVAIECDEFGKPVGSVVKQQGSPFMLIGMIDKAMAMLEDAKADIMKKFEETERLSRMIEKLPNGLAMKIRDLERRMRVAADKQDRDEMMRIQQELDQTLESAKDELLDFLQKKDKGHNPGNSDGDIDLSDFLKGGL